MITQNEQIIINYIGTFEVMKILNIKTRNTIYRWMSLGKLPLPYLDKKGHFLWKKLDVEAFKQKQLEKGIIL